MRSPDQIKEHVIDAWRSLEGRSAVSISIDELAELVYARQDPSCKAPAIFRQKAIYFLKHVGTRNSASITAGSASARWGRGSLRRVRTRPSALRPPPESRHVARRILRRVGKILAQFFRLRVRFIGGRLRGRRVTQAMRFRQIPAHPVGGFHMAGQTTIG